MPTGCACEFGLRVTEQRAFRLIGQKGAIKSCTLTTHGNGSALTHMKQSDELEESTDWSELIVLATSDPPHPAPLASALDRWAQAFTRDYKGPPLQADFPPAVEAFFRRICAADIPDEVVVWIDKFKQRRGRSPYRKELPERLRQMVPEDVNRGGRPRCDTARWRSISRAWVKHRYQERYEELREIFELGKLLGMSSCHGFEEMDISSDRTSSLAYEKLSQETGLSVSRLQDILEHRRRK